MDLKHKASGERLTSQLLRSFQEAPCVSKGEEVTCPMLYPCSAVSALFVEEIPRLFLRHGLSQH